MVPPRLVRRLLAPVFVAVELGLITLFAAVAVVAGLAAPFTPRRRVLRLAAFGTTYLAMEVCVAAAALVLWLATPAMWWAPSGPRPQRNSEQQRIWEQRHVRLLGWALSVVLGAGRRSCGFRMVVEGAPGGVVQGGGLEGDIPILVLARHGGPGDSFALAQLLYEHGRRVRIVLKAILQLDPALDVLLHRLGSCFLPARDTAGREPAHRVAALASTVSGPDAILLFPEGGNWTPRRRQGAIVHLRARRNWSGARVAEAMEHVLPPRPAGVLACLRARPDLDVVVVAHTGLDDLVTPGTLWGALPFKVPMQVRWWRSPAAALPDDDEGRLRWLTQEWAIVDEWIDARRSAH